MENPEKKECMEKGKVYLFSNTNDFLFVLCLCDICTKNKLKI